MHRQKENHSPSACALGVGLRQVFPKFPMGSKIAAPMTNRRRPTIKSSTASTRNAYCGNLPRSPDLVIVRAETEVAIISEAHAGTGSGCMRILGVTLGPRLGSVFLADGVAAHEGEGMPGGSQLGDCDFEGTRADDLFSERGLRARARASGFPHDDILSLTALADLGEPYAQELWRRYGEDLGRFIGPYVFAFGAEIFLVGGGFGATWTFFGATLNRTLGGIPARHGNLGTGAALEGLRLLAVPEKTDCRGRPPTQSALDPGSASASKNDRAYKTV